MRGHFSIEWLAQSSRASGSTSPSPPSSSWTSVAAGPTSTSGTHPESLPGFYSRPRPKNKENQTENKVRRGHGLILRSNPSLAGSETAKRSSPLHHKHQVVAETGFISGTEGETSGYESEGGRSLSPTTPLDVSSSPPTGRRPRTAYTAEQINSLERAFKRNAYLGTRDKVELCKKLNLSDKQIRNWFQNRRMRMKRMVQDALAQACQAKVASHLLHYPELHAYHPHHAGAEGGTATPYLHPHYSSSTASPALPNLPLDSFYQYSSLPGLVMPTTGSYQPYTHQY
ncbi:homeobox protein vent1-like [Oncorhynchus kisutch]|uniref:Ventrally expressed dharma/bozozok antagonist n=1 Tax=Oncorhynchus kisutch TaxID=8019 RepID=A0A8C7N1S8_ONCKI|nr:homeobox protein vent1-like [Oncorhynchus kisutch]